ncbi:MAG: TolC family protein [Deltaproteobacteria bacterium]|nr:TolC family protein [Deltaproteobacteria bacterium]MBI3016648.1 TolC family protein [Deltaproteobacteria bacterium]
MKNIAILLLIVSLKTTLVSATPLVISLEDVAQKVSEQNYEVRENAIQVYQAKESIQVARGNLLPKLNFWNIAAISFEPMMALGMADDVAPFLFPSRWIQVEEQKVMYLSGQESYRALWANEVLMAKALYLNVLLDMAILEHIDENKRQFETILKIAKDREQLGGIKPGSAREVEIQILALEEDKRALSVLIAQELNSLSYILGLPSETELTLAPVNLSDFETFEPLTYSDFEFRTLDSAPELRQLEHMIVASDLLKKEVTFDFWGLGTPASIRIAKAQKEALKIQKESTREKLKRELKFLVDHYNLDLRNYANSKRRSQLTQTSLNQQLERLRLGGMVEVNDLIESSRNHIQADTDFFRISYEFLRSEDKLARLIFYGDYDKKPAILEHLGEKRK